LRYIDAFSKEQLYAIAPQTTFQSGNHLHRANACIELPATTFARAMQLDCDIPYNRASNLLGAWKRGANHDNAKRYPALRGALPPVEPEHSATSDTLRRVAMLWVRLLENKKRAPMR
jgi:hypothetical protein